MKERDASPFLLSSLLKATPLGPSLVRRCLASFALSGGAHGFPKVPDPAVALRRPVQDTVPTGAPATHASPSPSPSPTLLLLSKQRRSAGVDLWRPAFAAHGSTPPRILKMGPEPWKFDADPAPRRENHQHPSPILFVGSGGVGLAWSVLRLLHYTHTKKKTS